MSDDDANQVFNLVTDENEGVILNNEEPKPNRTQRLEKQ